MNYWLILIPVLTALTGWCVIRLAAAALFFPRQPKRFLGIKIQGILPARQLSLAAKAGQFVNQEFQVFDGIEQKINDPRNFDSIKPVIEEHIDDFLRNKLKEQMPMISMFIGDKTITTLKTVFIAEIETLFPRVIGQFAGNLKTQFNIGEMVHTKLAAIPPATIESILYNGLKKHIKKAALLGALLGLLIGIIQLAILLFVL